MSMMIFFVCGGGYRTHLIWIFFPLKEKKYQNQFFYLKRNRKNKIQLMITKAT